MATIKYKGKLHNTPSGLRFITTPYNIFKTFHFHTLSTILFQNNTSVTFCIHWSVKWWRDYHICATWLPNVCHVANKNNFLFKKPKFSQSKKKLGKLHHTPSGLRSITIPYNIFKTFHFHTSRTILFQNNTFVRFSIH